MTPLPLLTRALRTAALALLPLLALAPAAHAGPLVFAPFSGSGNLFVIDPIAGTGAWNGGIAQFAEPGLADPLEFASLVLFTVDPLTQMLSGNFSFTRSSDLGASIFGLVTGSISDADPGTAVFGSSAQFVLEYSILGGTGDLAGASGFGLSFLQFDPAGVTGTGIGNGNGNDTDNFQENGLLAFSVPEPGTLPLLAGALGVLAVLRHRRRRLH